MPVSATTVEYVLGFGRTVSSGIAQRFSHAIIWLLRQRFNAAEAAFSAAGTDPLRRAFLDERAALGPD